MDENTNQKTSNKKVKIIIIAAIIIAIVAVIATILLTSIAKNSGIKENNLSSETDVIGYLNGKYNGETFKIIEKDSHGWKVKSESGYTFYVRMVKDKNGKSYITDGFTDEAVNSAVKYFESKYFTAKVNLSDYSIDLYNGDNLLDISNISEIAKLEITRLCSTITAYPQFKALNDYYRAAIVVVMNTADKNTTLKCTAGKDTFEELLR